MERYIYLLTWKMLTLKFKIAYNSVFIQNKLQVDRIDRWVDGYIWIQRYRHIVIDIDINENK